MEETKGRERPTDEWTTSVGEERWLLVVEVVD